MNLKVLCSSSQGNCYLLESETECLVLEIGVRFSAIKKALGFNISKIVGAVSSHLHQDHSKGIAELIHNAIPVLAGHDNFIIHNVPIASPFAKIIQEDKGYKMGNFKILPLPVEHDEICYAFLISHPEMGSLFFMTDTYYSPYHLEGCEHLMIETNYSDEILERNIMNSSVHPSMRPRLLQTHLELQTAKDIIRKADSPNLRNVILIHLSSQNSNEEQFVKEIRRVCGKPVYAAKKGLEVNFNINPY